MTTSQNEIVSQVRYFKPRHKTGESVFTSTNWRKPWQIIDNDDITKNAKVRFTRDGLCLITCFDKTRYREKGYEEIEHLFDGVQEYQKSPKSKKPITKSEPTKQEQEKNRRDSLTRAKKKVFEIASANEWHYMVTFTLNKEKIDRYDPKTVQKSFSAWLSNMVQRKDLKALIIPEYHPTDKAIHFHGLINDTLTFDHSNTYKVMGKKKPMREERLKRLKKTIHDDDVKPVYNIKEYKLGFSTAIPLDEQLQKEETSKNVTRVSHYITKYCTKDLDKIFGSYYIAVGKIERELPFILCNMDFDQLAEFGKVVKLPENYGTVCYATITKDDFNGSEIL